MQEPLLGNTGGNAAPTPAEGQDHSQIRRCKRTSCVKNRMRESRTSGSVRGGDGNIPTYSAQCRGNRPLRARGVVHLVVAAVGVGLQDAGEP